VTSIGFAVSDPIYGFVRQV